MALAQGDTVQYEFYNETVWVWTIPTPGGTKKLLYTFNSKKKAGRYLKRDC